MSRSRLVRLLVIVMAALIALPSFAGAAQGTASEFVSRYGYVALSNVEVQAWRDGSNYTIRLFIVPTDDEIAALRESTDSRVKEWSHVDFYFIFDGIKVPARNIRYSTDMSNHVRFIDDDVARGRQGPTVEMLGFNLGRWDDDANGFFVEATISGERLSRRVAPEVSVVMQSSVWWPAEGGCKVTGYLNKNDQDTCAIQDGPSYTLMDFDGYTSFLFDD